MRLTADGFAAWADDRQLVHDASAEQTQRSIRKRVREKALELGVACPEWVAIQQAGPTKTTASRAAKGRGSPLRPAGAASDVGSGAAAPGARHAKPGAAWRHQKIPQRKAAGAELPGVPVELPAELRAWRGAGYGRCVQLHGSSVVLHEIGTKPVKYASVAEAVAAHRIA